MRTVAASPPAVAHDAIPPQDVDRLFEPFQRLESGRPAEATSSGLGLAIVRSIVRAHCGTVEAAPMAEGGLTVTVTLPTRDTRSRPPSRYSPGRLRQGPSGSGS
jgi:K+-sensing histidine kinase KdpD